MTRWLLTLLTGALIVETLRAWRERRAEKRAERKKLAEQREQFGGFLGRAASGGFVKRFRRNER